MFTFKMKLICEVEPDGIVRLYQTTRKFDPTEFYHAVANFREFCLDDGKYTLDKDGCDLNKKEYITNPPFSDEIVYWCHPHILKNKYYATKEQFIYYGRILKRKDGEYEMAKGDEVNSNRIEFMLSIVNPYTKEYFTRKLNFFRRLNTFAVDVDYRNYCIDCQREKNKIDKVVDEAWEKYSEEKMNGQKELLERFEEKHLEILNDDWIEIKK
jgi:hypothetical protein